MRYDVISADRLNGVGVIFGIRNLRIVKITPTPFLIE